MFQKIDSSLLLKSFLFLFLISIQSTECFSSQGKTGAFPKTNGGVWPQPQAQTTYKTYLLIQPDEFSFSPKHFTCDILQDAVVRYFQQTFTPPRLARPRNKGKPWKNDPNFQGYLSNLEIHLESSCETWPSLQMDEQYDLNVNSKDSPNNAILHANSIWGVLRGLETFSQLVYRNDRGVFQINTTSITDFPRFPHRGILLDTARHYLPKHILLTNLDAMAQNKFNVFHWHIVDDQSFPYQSLAYPEMSEEGSYNAYTHIYSLADIAEIIEFARLRGIRVIPEFDTPGHTLSWGNGIPNLLTQCFKNNSGKLEPDGFGPINPILDSTYKFLASLLGEVVRVFPDKYIHLGGDEVSFSCWQSNPDILAFMKKQGFGQDFSKLEGYFEQRLLDIVKSFPGNDSYIIYQEIIDNNVTVKGDTIVEVWKDPHPEEMAKITAKGYRTLLSACWYLDYISYGSDWKNYYACDPHAFNGTAEQKKLVIGGEACLWAEFIDATNLTPRLWPRASATAERLWSAQTVNDTSKAASRFEEHRCRMVVRGVDAEPQNGPSFCEVDYRI